VIGGITSKFWLTNSDFSGQEIFLLKGNATNDKENDSFPNSE